MKSVILYASNHGFTADCALKLKEKLKGDTDIYDVKKELVHNLEKYDTIIIGGPIYAGKIPGKLKKAVSKNMETILKKNIGVFITAGDTKTDYIAANFPEEMLNKTFEKEHFGAGMYPERLSFFEKIILKMIKKYESFEKYNDEAIEKFAKSVNNL